MGIGTTMQNTVLVVQVCSLSNSVELVSSSSLSKADVIKELVLQASALLMFAQFLGSIIGLFDTV
jgi:hypothetical protein